MSRRYRQLTDEQRRILVAARDGRLTAERASVWEITGDLRRPGQHVRISLERTGQIRRAGQRLVLTDLGRERLRSEEGIGV